MEFARVSRLSSSGRRTHSDLFREDFYVDGEAVRRAIERREAFNAIEMTRVVKTDFAVRKESAYRRTEFARKRRVSVDEHELSIVAPEDLVIPRGERMNDTPPEVERRYHAMLLQRSSEARLLMGDSMYATARALVRASILAATPHASPAEMRQQIFLRFYGHEFDAPARDKILAVLDAAPRAMAQ
jgi:hypothetical protein